MRLILFSSASSLHRQLINYVLANNIVVRSNTDPASLLPALQLIDPNPALIDEKNGSLINNATAAASINTTRIADGVSRLLLVTPYKNLLNFSIIGDKRALYLILSVLQAYALQVRLSVLK